MRFALVAGIAVVVLGVVAGYSRFAGRVAPRRPPARVTEPTEDLTLEMELTFEATGDAFQPEPLAIVLNGRSVAPDTIVSSGPFRYRVALRDGWRRGVNRLHVEAVGPAKSLGPSRAVHLRLWRGDIPLRETTLWAPSGEPVMGTWVVQWNPGEGVHD